MKSIIAGMLAWMAGIGGASATALQAAQQVATVIASMPFELRGVRVTPAGVPSWPVSAGDEVATESWPVSFQFPDGSQITLEPNSRARIEGTKKSPVFRLIECTADYRLKRLGSVGLYRNGQAERISKTEGQYTMGCRPAATTATAGAATAATTAATAGVASAGVSAGAAGAASAAAASASAATAGIASVATVGATAAAAAGVATSVGVVSATNAGAPPPISTP